MFVIYAHQCANQSNVTVLVVLIINLSKSKSPTKVYCDETRIVTNLFLGVVHSVKVVQDILARCNMNSFIYFLKAFANKSQISNCP